MTLLGYLHYLLEDSFFEKKCQMIIAFTAFVTLLITIYNLRLSIKTKKKSSEMELRKNVYDLMLKCRKINDNVNGDLSFYLVEKELWNTIDNVLLKIDYLKHNDGKKTDIFVYRKNQNDKKKARDIILNANQKVAYHNVNNFLKENVSIVSKIKNNQANYFDDDVLFLKAYMISTFTRYRKCYNLLKKYINSLNKYRNICVFAVNDIDELIHLKELSNIIPDYSHSNKTNMSNRKKAENKIKNKLGGYINKLINNKFELLNEAQTDIITNYYNLENELQLSLLRKQTIVTKIRHVCRRWKQIKLLYKSLEYVKIPTETDK